MVKVKMIKNMMAKIHRNSNDRDGDDDVIDGDDFADDDDGDDGHNH